jgi:hypothetical protein
VWFDLAGLVIVWREVGVAQRRPWEVDDDLWELIEPLLPKVERLW